MKNLASIKNQLPNPYLLTPFVEIPNVRKLLCPLPAEKLLLPLTLEEPDTEEEEIERNERISESVGEKESQRDRDREREHVRERERKRERERERKTE